MKELLKEKYKQYIKEVDNQYKDVLINEFGEDFKYIFEVPSNFFVYTNYKDCHEEGYLSDGVCIEEECDYLDTILAPLGYSNMSDSTYGWEAGEDPLFTKKELIELLNNSIFIQATDECSFTTEKEDIEKGKHGQEIYAHFFCWNEQLMLETVEDYLATLNVGGHNMLCNNCKANLKEVGINLKTFVGCSYDKFEDKFVVMNISDDIDTMAFCGKCNNMVNDEILKETEFIL